jgi:hypothetical protein
MKDFSRDEYISEIQYCYENSRWEFSFYAVLYSYFCQFRNDKIKLVHCADWKSRGAKTSKAMNENLELCSIKFNDKDGKEHIGGIPDFQFVSTDYSYGKPCKANVFIEFKAPNFSDEGVYLPLIYVKTLEIEHQFKKCDKIIFTDGLSWYFLEKSQSRHQENPINLLDNNDNWNKLKIKITNFIKKN